MCWSFIYIFRVDKQSWIESSIVDGFMEFPLRPFDLIFTRPDSFLAQEKIEWRSQTMNFTFCEAPRLWDNWLGQDARFDKTVKSNMMSWSHFSWSKHENNFYG